MTLWGRDTDAEPPADEPIPTLEEISAFDLLLSDREQYYRRRGWFERMWPQTELLYSLRQKMRRLFHSRHE